MVHVERQEVDSKPEMMSSSRHADSLEREVSLLQAKIEQQACTIRDLHAEAVEQARLREAAEVEVVEQREDIVEQACDQGDLENQIHRLDKERTELRASLVRVRADLSVMERKYDEAQRHLADKEELARKPEMELAQKERKNQQLQKQLEAKAVLIKTIKEELEEARRSGKPVEADVIEEETRERLLQKLSSAHRAQAFSEEKCWQLEEQLEDRDRALEEAQGKLQNLSDQLHKKDERRHELEQNLREAKEKSPEEAQVQSLRGDILERDAQLQRAMERVATLEKMNAELQSKPQASGSDSLEELQTVKKRCHDLETAGKKLLKELDDKDRQLHTQESATCAAHRRVNKLEALLTSLSLPASEDAVSITQRSASGVKLVENNDIDVATTQRVWISGSCRDSGSEVWISGSGGEGSLDESIGTRRLRRVRIQQPRHDDLVQPFSGESKPSTPLRRRPGSPAFLRPRSGVDTPSRERPFPRQQEEIVTWRGRKQHGPSSDDRSVESVAEATSSREHSSDSGQSWHSGIDASDVQTGVRWKSRRRGGTPLRRLLEDGSTGQPSNDGGHNAQLLRHDEEVWKWTAGVGVTSRSASRSDRSDEWLAKSSWYGRYDGDHSLRVWDDTKKWFEGGDTWSGYNYYSGWNSYSQ